MSHTPTIYGRGGMVPDLDAATVPEARTCVAHCVSSIVQHTEILSCC